MTEPLVIDQRRRRPAERARQWLRGRRLMLGGVLALVEVIVFILWRPSPALLGLLAIVLLALAVIGATRVGPGLLRDVLWIIAIAEALIVVIPLATGLALITALLTAMVLIVGLILVAARWRV